MVNKHLKEVDALARKGVGIACLHYGVEVPKGEPGDMFLKWIGGYFETWWSVNPTWTAEFKEIPRHPITRGVRPFTINDEWYYHMRFRSGLEGVTPILSAIPPESAISNHDDPHGGNKYVRAEKGQPQHLAWACERSDGGRGFGFTGGHDHYNWGCDNYRKLILNAIVWVAKGEIPEDGIPSKTATLEDLKKNQSSEMPKNYDWDRIRRDLEQWNRKEKESR
jgi:hypothetical protein